MNTNGHNNGHAADEAIDHLFAYWPGTTPAPPPCPEACFSLTLRGKLDGQDCMVTVRGMTASEFQANLQQVRGLLDPVTQAAPAPTQGQEGYCAKHQVPMKLNHGKDGKSDWYSHRHLGEWCQGKGR